MDPIYATLSTSSSSAHGPAPPSHPPPPKTLKKPEYADIQGLSRIVSSAFPTAPGELKFNVDSDAAAIATLITHGRKEYALLQGEYGKIGYVTGRQMAAIVQLQKSLLNTQDVGPVIELLRIYLVSRVSYRTSVLSHLKTQLDIITAIEPSCTATQQGILARVRNRLTLHTGSYEKTLEAALEMIFSNEEELIAAIKAGEVTQIMAIVDQLSTQSMPTYGQSVHRFLLRLQEISMTQRSILTEDEIEKMGDLLSQTSTYLPQTAEMTSGYAQDEAPSDMAKMLRMVDSSVMAAIPDLDFPDDVLENYYDYADAGQSHEEDNYQAYTATDTVPLYTHDDEHADAILAALQTIFSHRYIAHAEEAVNGNRLVCDLLASYCVLSGLMNIELPRQKDPRIIPFSRAIVSPPIAVKRGEPVLLDSPLQIEGAVLEMIVQAFGFSDVPSPQIVIMIGQVPRVQRKFMHLLISQDVSPEDIGEAVLVLQTPEEYQHYVAKQMIMYFAEKGWGTTVCCSSYYQCEVLAASALRIPRTVQDKRIFLPPNLTPLAAGCVYQAGQYGVLDLVGYLELMQDHVALGHVDHVWEMKGSGEISVDGEDIGILGVAKHDRRLAHSFLKTLPAIPMCKPVILLHHSKMLLAMTAYDISVYPMKTPYATVRGLSTAMFTSHCMMGDAMPREVEIYGMQATYKGEKSLSNLLVEAQLKRSSELDLCIMLPFVTPLGVGKVTGPGHEVLAMAPMESCELSTIDPRAMETMVMDSSSFLDIYPPTGDKPFALRGNSRIYTNLTWKDLAQMPDLPRKLANFFLTGAIGEGNSESSMVIKTALSTGNIGPIASSHLSSLGLGKFVGLYHKFKSVRHEVLKSVKVHCDNGDDFVDLFTMEFGASYWNLYLLAGVILSLGVAHVHMEMRGSRSYILVSEKEVASVRRERFRNDKERPSAATKQASGKGEIYSMLMEAIARKEAGLES